MLLSPLPPPEGGIATWTCKYQQYCTERDVSLSIVNIAVTGTRGTQINAKKNLFDEWKRTRHILRDFKAAIRKERPRVIHLNTSCSRFGIIRDYLCARIAKKKKIPLVLQCHCHIPTQMHGKMSRFFLKKLVSISCCVLTLNSPSNDYVNTVAPGKGMVLPNFIEREGIGSVVVRETVKEILFVGHVQRTKGCFEILEAAKRLPEYHFTLVGPVAQEIELLSCPPNVSLMGRKTNKEVMDCLLEADIFLFPSYSEGFSVSMLEAMSKGLPIVASDVGANRDMIEDQGGIIVPSQNVDALVDAIQSLQDSTLRDKMSKWNRSKVEAEYMLDAVMDRLFGIYHRYVKQS